MKIKPDFFESNLKIASQNAFVIFQIHFTILTIKRTTHLMMRRIMLVSINLRVLILRIMERIEVRIIKLPRADTVPNTK